MIAASVKIQITRHATKPTKLFFFYIRKMDQIELGVQTETYRVQFRRYFQRGGGKISTYIGSNTPKLGNYQGC